ncbi:cyclic nucleotide-gated ion channel 1 [Rosa chinensis]|uniref:cyclic nucleotide-gated ion channel 1 n=1 Tax=Rosa chinensis TaxID=74649 RepID=UPI001AD912A1|nr:cyclic nucleotide-gated ion channel 1 [Rosa chinensis]
MAANLEITLDVLDNSEQQQQAHEPLAAINQESDYSQSILLPLQDYITPNTTRSTKPKFVVLVWLTMKTIFVKLGVIRELVRLLFHWISSHWKIIFVISCVLAVLMDPLFLYTPIMNHDLNHEIKCLGIDKKLYNVATGLRSVTDLSYLVDIFAQVYTYETISRLYILIDILAVLPLPQIVVLVFFTKARDWISLNLIRKIVMNCLVLLQYIPRILRIHFLCKELKETLHGEVGLWVKGVFNFLLYLLSSHVLGALWYFYGIQKMTTCWQYSCQENRCEPLVFDCDYEFRDSTLLKWCPIKPPNATIFDFGIFIGVLQSDISGSKNFVKKFLNCFSWGVRNLSSLGSNLEASSDTGENLFTAAISVIGLLLFLYLIGNLQSYMQSNSARREAHDHKIRIERKLEEKGPEIESWLSVSSPFIPVSSKDNVKSQIMRKVKQELEGNRDIDGEDILSILPLELRSYIQSYTTVGKLKTVPKLQNMDEMVLQEMCKHLKPMSYSANSYIIREKEPLDIMLLIMDGAVKVESSINEFASTMCERGDLCGEELVDWASDPLFPTILPFSTITVQAMNNVEARVLTASDLNTVVSLFWQHFSEGVFAPPPDLVRFNRLGLGNLPQLISALHLESV